MTHLTKYTSTYKSHRLVAICQYKFYLENIVHVSYKLIQSVHAGTKLNKIFNELLSWSPSSATITHNYFDLQSQNKLDKCPDMFPIRF